MWLFNRLKIPENADSQATAKAEPRATFLYLLKAAAAAAATVPQRWIAYHKPANYYALSKYCKARVSRLASLRARSSSRGVSYITWDQERGRSYTGEVSFTWPFAYFTAGSTVSPFPLMHHNEQRNFPHKSAFYLETTFSGSICNRKEKMQIKEANITQNYGGREGRPWQEGLDNQ